MEEKMMNVGDFVFAQTVQGTIIAGMLSAKGQLCTENGVENFYAIVVTDKTSFQLKDSEIYAIKRLDKREELIAEKEEYIKKLEEKCNVQLVCKDGTVLGDVDILGRLMYYGVWENMSEDEKVEFIDKMGIPADVQLGIFDLFQKRQKMLNKYQNERRDHLFAKNNFQSKYRKMKDVYPPIEAIYQFMCEKMGMKTLVE